MIKIKEIKKLMKDVKNPIWKKQLESDLKCYLAIKDLLERED